MVYYDETLAYGRTHNNENAKLGHHNGCSSFPKKSIATAWQSRIYLKHCVICLDHYWDDSCTAFAPLHYIFVLLRAIFACTSLFVSACLFTCATHVTWYHLLYAYVYTSVSVCLLIFPSLFTDTSSHTWTANNTQRRSYYPSREYFSVHQPVCIPNWLLSLLSSWHCSSGVGWPG